MPSLDMIKITNKTCTLNFSGDVLAHSPEWYWLSEIQCPVSFLIFKFTTALFIEIRWIFDSHFC